MKPKVDHIQHYTIQEVSKLCGLPSSTLRYYETIGLIHPIHRDESSKHRTYSEDDVNYAIALACLNSVGLSIEDMRSYMKNFTLGAEAAQEQVALLEPQKKRIAEEAKHLKLRQEYIDVKISYWKAVAKNDTAQIEAMGEKAFEVAKALKLPQPVS